MKKIFLAIGFILSVGIIKAQSLETFHDFMGIGILGDTINFSDYAGKKVIVVNTASYCGFTPQFDDLALLDSIYGGPDFAIIGFPCNDFGAQDPGSDSAINTFATGIYNIQFQLMSKISITAPDTAEVYKWLQLQSRNGVADAPVTWNFNKFCIDELGRWVHHFGSTTNPLDTAITNWINSPSVLGINSPIEDNQIALIGNPVHDQIALQLNLKTPGDLSINLFDTKGSFIQEIFNGNTTGKKLISSSVNNVKPGIYFIKVTGSNYNQVLKIVIAN